jgi:HEAT repeat protein
MPFSLEDILGALAYGDPTISEHEVAAYLASRSLSSLENDLLPIIRNSLSDLDPRIEALRILLLRGTDSSLLVELKSDSDVAFRVAVLEFMLRFGSLDACFHSLVGALATDPDASVRYWAAEFLGDLGDRRAIQFLTDAATKDFGISAQGYEVSDAAKDALRKFK